MEKSKQYSGVAGTDLVKCSIRGDIVNNHVRELLFRCVGMRVEDSPTLLFGSDSDYGVKAIRLISMRRSTSWSFIRSFIPVFEQDINNMSGNEATASWKR